MVRKIDHKLVAQIVNSIFENPNGFIPPILVHAEVPAKFIPKLRNCSNLEAANFFETHPEISLVVYGSTHTVIAYLMLNKYKLDELKMNLKDQIGLFFNKDLILYINCPQEVLMQLGTRHNSDSDVHKKMSEYEKILVARKVCNCLFFYKFRLWNQFQVIKRKWKQTQDWKLQMLLRKVLQVLLVAISIACLIS